MTLQAEKLDLKEKIKSAIVSGNIFELNKFKRAKSELDDRIYFQNLKEKRERLKELSSDRDNALDLRNDLESELRANNAVISSIREKLEAAESEHRELTAKLFYLDSTIDSNRRSISEMERDIQKLIEEKIVEVTN